MKSISHAALALALVLFPAKVEAQYSPVVITDTDPAVIGFVDITNLPGVLAIPNVTDDSSHGVTGSVTNVLWPSISWLVSNNGAVVNGVNMGQISNNNVPIPGTGLPVTPPGASPVVPPNSGTCLFPFWDDLFPTSGSPSNTTIYAIEGQFGNVAALIIEWVNETHFEIQDVTRNITFQVQIFDNITPTCQPLIQFVYFDTYFGTGVSQFGGVVSKYNEGGDATIGITSAAGNCQWSFNQHSVASFMVLSVHFNISSLIAASPLGPGSLFLHGTPITCGGDSHILAVTSNGSIQNGFLLGLNIPVPELLQEISIGSPFTGPGADLFLGPFVGLPPITFQACMVELKQGTFFGGAPAIQYTIP